MKFLSKLALAWLFAWLPISGVMAATMPFCAQGIGNAAQQTESVTDASTPCHPVDKRTSENELDIEHCDLCHIAGALLPPNVPVVANTSPGLPPADAAISDFCSHIPDPLQHPPLSSPA